MKNLIAVFVLLLVTPCFAQEAKLHLKGTADTTYIETDRITYFNESKIVGIKNTYNVDDIIGILFYSKPSNQLFEYLDDRNIKMVDRYTNSSYAQEAARIRKDLIPKEEQNKNVAVTLFKIVGAGLITSSLVLSNSEVPIDFTLDDLESRRKTSKTLGLIGVVTLSIGFLID